MGRHLVTAGVWFVSALLATPPSSAALRVVPTFENCSVYVEESGLSPAQLRIRYRPGGEEDWQAAHPLAASSNDPVPRGSLFGLKPGSRYEVQCLGPDDQVLADAEFTTWTEDVPVAKTIRLESRIVPGRPLRIDQGGSPDGWVRYVGGGGLAVDAQQSAVAAVTIENAPYVLLDEVTVRGGQRHGIHVVDSHHVRIRRCDIAGFGRVGRQDLTKDGKYYDEQGRAINNDAGVCIERSGQVVVERCYIHDPRNHANSWFYSHPAGPNAIYLRNVPGQLVVRYNDLVGSNLHRWNDVIEASGNGEVDGGFHCDSDIYGNYLAFANDDAIELDGGQCNVRFYGNHCEGTLCGVSTAANRRGPSYVIGNVICELGDERGRAGAGTKNGGGTTYSQGTTFFYHNTFFTAGDGIAAVGFGNDRNRGMFLGVSRNNVFAVSGDGIRDPYAPAPCDYDYDLFATPWESSGTLAVGRAVESHALATAARFVDAASGIFRPRPDSPARGTGVQLAGMSVFQSGNAVDRGALSVSGSTDLVPWRPTVVRVHPARLAFRGARAEQLATTRQVTIDARRLSRPQAYRIVQNEATDWLRVEPAHGTLQPGSRQQLTASLIPNSGALAVPPVGAFLVQLSDEIGLPVTVYAEVPEHDFQWLAEAESLSGAGGFASRVEATARCKYLEFAASRDDARGLDVEIDVPHAGTYQLYFRVRCPQPLGRHDSVYVRIDEGVRLNVPLDVGGQGWHWAAGRSEGAEPLLRWESGRRRIRIEPRETFDLDAVQIRTTTLPLADRG